MIFGKRTRPKSALDSRSLQNLSEWLEAATLNLVASAKSRVGSEIEAHFTEGVQYYLQNGMAESAAREAALADLGDAHAAARRFRQEYLTIQEMNELKAIHVRSEADDAQEKAALQPVQRFWRDPVIRNSFWSLLFTILVEYLHPMDWRQFSFLAVSLLALPFAGALHLCVIFVWVRKIFDVPVTRAFPRHQTAGKLKVLVLWLTSFTLFFVALSTFLSEGLSHSYYFPALLLVGFVMIQALASVYLLAKFQRVSRLYKKLDASPDERQELFPDLEKGEARPDPFPN